MGEIRIDVPDPLVDLVAIEQRVLRRRLPYTGLLGNNVISAPVVNHVTLSNSTLSLGHPGLVLTSVSISPSTATFAQVGQFQQFTAVALDQNRNPLAVQPPIGWSTSVPAVAAVNSSGLATCAGTNGVTTIAAFVVGQPNFFANASVTTNLQALTVNHVTVTPGTLNLLHTVSGPQIPQVVLVTPQNATLPLGQTLPLAAQVQTAAGTGLSGFTPTWESTNQAVATVSSTGVVTPVTQGTTTIYASVIDQGQTLNTYANLKGFQHGYTVNYHYQGENPYQANYSKVYADLVNGIATEEVAANAFHLTTSASTPGNIVWSQPDLAVLDAQVAKVKATGARMMLYWLNGDVSNGEPSWFSQITSPALAQQALTGLCTFMALRYQGQVEYVLFNELMKSFGEQPNGYQTNTFITQMGQSFLATGPAPGFFAYAAAAIHAADPAAKIWINCNHSESDLSGDATNWTNILAMLTGLVGQFCPLTGFRFECHQNLSLGATIYTQLKSRINQVLALGLKYGLGELDNPDDIVLGGGPSQIWQRDEAGAAIRTAILTACLTSNAPPDHVMEWQDSSQTSWLNSPPEAGAGGTVPGGSVYDRQAHTLDGDSFTVSGQTFYTHEVVPATGSLGQTASGNALNVMVTPAVGTALTSGAAVTYTQGLTGGNLVQTGGITLSANAPTGAFRLPLTATTLTGTTIEGTHGRPNSRDESYVATPNYRAHLQAYGGPVGSTTLTVVPQLTGFTFPNLPGGMTLITTRPNQAVTNDGTPVWGNEGPTGFNVIRDTTVPLGGPNVAQVVFNGTSGGNPPFGQWTYGPIHGKGYTKIYMAFAYKIDPNFVANSPSGVQKIFYVNDPTCGAVVYYMHLGTSPPYYPQMRTQSGTGVCGLSTVNYGPQGSQGQVAGATNYSLTPGQWYIWEAFCQINTPGSQNGIFRSWITANGVTTHVIESTTVNVSATGSWDSINWEPVWGGGGGTAPNCFTYMGEIVVYAA